MLAVCEERLACCCYAIVVLMDMAPSAEDMLDKGLHVWGRSGAASWEDQYRMKNLVSKDSIANTMRDMTQEYTHMTH